MKESVQPMTAKMAYDKLRKNRKVSLCLLISSCLASLVAFFTINYNFRASLSGGRAETCFLNSKWDINTQSLSSSVAENDDSGERAEIPIGGNVSLEMSTQENHHGCQFVECVFVLSFVISFFLIWFFIIFKTSESRFYKQKPTTGARLIPPAIFIAASVGILQIVAAILYTVGFAEWCQDGVTIDKVPRHCSSLREVALNLSDKSAIRGNIYAVAIVAAISALISALLWVALAFSLVQRIRCKLDFPEKVDMPSQLPTPSNKVYPKPNHKMLAAATEALEAVNKIDEKSTTPTTTADSKL